MARVEKCTAGSVRFRLQHNNRETSNPSNKDIDPARTHLNMKLSPDRTSKAAAVPGAKIKLNISRPISDMEYFRTRLQELEVYNRKDVKTACEWIVDAPKDLRREDYPRFFEEVYRFLADRYGGERNVISSVIHADEGAAIGGGAYHLHHIFCPVVPNNKPGGKAEKVCAKDVIHREELRAFHPALQAHLDAAGIKCSIITGKTKGRSRPMKLYKREQEQARQQHERSREQKGVFVHEHTR